VQRLHVALVQFSEQRRRVVSFLLGAVGSLAFAPCYVFPVLVPALTGLLWLVTSASCRRTAFAVGWWFGLGHFLVGFYWVGKAFTVADIGVAAGVIAVGFLAAVSALAIGAVGL
ncbi:uncharacterized protein METZ01_LOCUS258876, partial [marine metagenome]